MSNQDLIINITEKLFLGFGLTTLLAITFSFIKSPNFRKFLSKFINTSIKIIRVLGIIYFFYYLIRLVIFYSSNEVTVMNERAVGPYAWAYWMMLLRPFVFCLLTQLFWIKKVQNTRWTIFLNTLLIFLIVLGSGVNFERFVIILTSYHRDYLPNNSVDSSILYYPFILIISLIENIALFSSIIFIAWVAKDNLNARKMINIRDLKSYHLFWIFALISIVISIIEYYVLKESTIDINVHDTYFVIAHFQITSSIFIALFTLGILYYIFNRINFNLIKVLTKTHVYITCFSIPAYYIGISFINLLKPNNGFPLVDNLSHTNVFISILILVVLIAQFLFILNILFSSLRRLIRKS